ncbi:kelch-like protein 5 [Ylistrum balloti]|uniref:kelch-like protein 5 n=1 Tax=Ylistrum balloti TaxID=509963 RepID=UPI002905E9B3|nr:kelch-like protein 5 [Ylistrum balloti]
MAEVKLYVPRPQIVDGPSDKHLTCLTRGPPARVTSLRKESQDKTKDRKASTSSESTDSHGASNKSKSTKSSVEPKTNGNHTAPKRDLTAPTKSSSAKAKPVAPPKKPLLTPLKKEKSEPVKKTEKPSKNGSNKKKTGSSESLQEAESKPDKGKTTPSKDKPVEVSVCNKTEQSTSASLSSPPPAVTPPRDTVDQSKESSQLSSAIQANTNNRETADQSKESSQLTSAISDDTNSKETVHQLEECSQHSSVVLANPKDSMAACDPHTIAGINPETTDRMRLSKGKVKYINLTYKKKEARIYDHKCDVKVHVGKETFRAHRDVLSESSDYFAAMFSHDMKEKEQDVIELKEISPKGITVILEYFYHGYITVDNTNIEDIIEAARFFHVEWILEVSCDFLVHSMSIENYSAVLVITDKYSLGDLQFEILTFFSQNLEELSKEDDFHKTLSYELLLQFLMEDIYIEFSEYFLVQVLLKWLAVDPAGRRDQFESLLRQIRFYLVETEELESMPEEVTNVSELKEEIESAINHNLNIMGQCLKSGEKYLPRGCRRVATIFSFSEEGYFIIYRDPNKAGITMEQLGPCGLDSTDYQAMSQAKIGNFLYAAGGYDQNFSSTARMFRFDPRFRDWTEVAPMNEPRVSFCLCSSDQQLFAVGGIHRIHIDDDNEPETILDSVEIYNPQDNQWTNTTPLPIKVFDMSAAYYDGSLYVCGGISADPHLPCPVPRTYSLKLGSNQWVQCTDMITSRQGHSLTPYKDKLYAIGGYCMPDNNFRECVENEVYDIKNDQWTQFSPVPIEFGHLYRHNGILNGVIFLIGGSTPEASLFMYDIEADKWEEVEEVGANVQKLAILDVAYPLV